MLKQVFAKALDLFNRQDYAAVIATCLPHQQHPMFMLMMASAYGKLEQFAEAEKHFVYLEQRYPTNVDVLFNFALVLKLQQRWDEAKALLQKSLRLNHSYHPAHYALADVFAKLGDTASAKLHFEHATALQPSNADYLYGAAEHDFMRQDYISAQETLTAVLKQSCHRPSLRLVSAVFYKVKYTGGMRQLCQRFADQIKSEPDVLCYAGLIELDEKCYIKARQLLTQAQSSAGSSRFEIDANMLYCDFLLQPNVQILKKITSLTLQEATSEAFHFCANLLETLGQLDEAEQLLAKALDLYPDAQDLLLIKAKVLARKDKLSAALAMLNAVTPVASKELFLEVCYQKIQIFEGQKDYHSAAEQIEIAAKSMPEKQLLDNLEKDAERAVADLSATEDWYAAHSRKLIFIVGFPRSGTTLLESRLSSLPDVKILEETNAVKQFYQKLESQANGVSVMTFLAALTEQQRAELAEQYVASLQDYVDIAPHNIVIDKMPLNGLYLAPVLALFPNACVILMQRHPMDVCISSLKQRMINLFSVDSFAKSYHCYFNVLETLAERYTERVFSIKYEALVSDYPQTFASILQHCSLNVALATADIPSKTPTMHNTPSYYQVSQPIYNKAVNAYQHYQEFFNFQHPLLVRWCRKLDYQISSY